MNYFKVPAGKKVQIFESNGTALKGTMDIDLILDSEVSLSLASNFEPIVSPDMASWTSIISGGVNAIASAFSGGTAPKIGTSSEWLGFQIWKGTSPAKISVTVCVNLGENAVTSFFNPIKALLKLPMPSKVSGFGIVGPGPDILKIIGNGFNQTWDTGGGVNGANLAMSIGWLFMPWVIVTGAEPTWALDTNEKGVPIWCKVTLEIQSVMTPTVSDIDIMFDPELTLHTTNMSKEVMDEAIRSKQ